MTIKKKNEKQSIFFDSNVILGLLKKDPKLMPLISLEMSKKYEFIINSIVLQEILAVIYNFGNAELKNLESFLAQFKIYEIKMGNAELKQINIQTLRNEKMHSNDALNIVMAISRCDYFITQDKEILRFKASKKMKIMTPLDFLKKEGGAK